MNQTTLITSLCDPTGPCTGDPPHGSCECYPAYLALENGENADLMDFAEWQRVVSTPDD